MVGNAGALNLTVVEEFGLGIHNKSKLLSICWQKEEPKSIY